MTMATRLLLPLLAMTLAGCAQTSERAADVPVRAAHMVVRHVTPADVERFAQLAAQNGYNTVVLNLSADTVPFESVARVRTRHTWAPGQLEEALTGIRALGLEIVPEVSLLTHQQKLLANKYPDLMYNRLTYDPTNPELQALTRNVIDEVLALTGARAFHIGHDEVAGRVPALAQKELAPDEAPLPAALFAESVRYLHDYLSARNVETWIWGDMLLAPREFPDMYQRHMHGEMSGYGRALRAQLPKDLVVCDWHYYDEQPHFPTVERLRAEGFRVLGSVWDRQQTTENFSRHAARNGAHGMIATTWWHVQKGNWDEVEAMLTAAGRAFAEDFPDPR